MRYALLLVLLSSACLGQQPIYSVEPVDWTACALRAPGTNPAVVFAPQGSTRIPGLQEYAICIVAPQGQDLRLEGIRLVVEALHRNIRLYSYAPLNRYVQDLNRADGWIYVPTVCEVAGMAATIPISGDLAEVKEKVVKVAVPTITAGCAIMRYIGDKHHVNVEIPRDLYQPLIFVPAGTVLECSGWAFQP